MKQLKDLKEELLVYNLQNFYVFYGEDFGIKHHYIERIKSKCDNMYIINSAQDLLNSRTGSSLFQQKNLYVILNDMDFANWKQNDIELLIHRLDTDILIVCYEQELSTSNLFKNFSDYITAFPHVKTNIAVEFIDLEVCLSLACKEDLAYHCNNDYGTIQLECDKIKNYAQQCNISEQEAYESLRLQNQLIYRIPELDVEQFMNDILSNNTDYMHYWYTCVMPAHIQDFWISLNYIFYTFMIAYILKKYGSWHGSEKAYKYGLPWNRIKTLRQLNIYYNSNQLLDIIYRLCDMDILVKQKRLSMDQIYDYFLCYVI